MSFHVPFSVSRQVTTFAVKHNMSISYIHMPDSSGGHYISNTLNRSPRGTNERSAECPHPSIWNSFWLFTFESFLGNLVFDAWRSKCLRTDRKESTHRQFVQCGESTGTNLTFSGYSGWLKRKSASQPVRVCSVGEWAKAVGTRIMFYMKYAK